MMSNASKDGKHHALARTAEMFERAPVALTLADAQQPDAPLVVANSSFLSMVGYARDEVIGRNCRFLQGDLDNRSARAEVRACLEERSSTQILLLNRRKNGDMFRNLLFLETLTERDGTVAYYLGSQFELHDTVTEQAIDRHMREIDDAVTSTLRSYVTLRSKQRRMLSDAAHAVASAWLSLR